MGAIGERSWVQSAGCWVLGGGWSAKSFVLHSGGRWVLGVGRRAVGRRAVGGRFPLGAAAPTPCRGRASSTPVRTPPHRRSVASRRGHSAAASPGCRHRRGAGRQRVTSLTGRGGSGRLGGVLLLWAPLPQSRLACLLSICSTRSSPAGGGRNVPSSRTPRLGVNVPHVVRAVARSIMGQVAWPKHPVGQSTQW